MVETTGLSALQESYQFQFDVVYTMLLGLTHEALRASDVDVAIGFATDAKIKQLQLVSLQDDKSFFPVYYVAPVLREEILLEHPQIKSLLSDIVARLDTETMIALNYRVEIEEQDLQEVVQNWLEQEGLLSLSQETTGSTPVRIGSHERVKHHILSRIVIVALEAAGIPIEDHTQSIAPGRVRELIVNRQIDLYWEYGRADYSIQSENSLRGYSGEDAYALAAQRDADKGLVWLGYAPFISSRALLMRQEHAQELGITSISELADWVQSVQAQMR